MNENDDQTAAVVRALLDSGIPREIVMQRVALWIVVNWLLPLHLQPQGTDVSAREPDYFAMRSQLLQRAPTLGESCAVPRHRAEVDGVLWTEDGRVLVELKPASVEASYLDELRGAGWNVFPREDPDAWFSSLLG